MRQNDWNEFWSFFDRSVLGIYRRDRRVLRYSLPGVESLTVSLRGLHLWIGAWLGGPVLGHWWFQIQKLYIIPAARHPQNNHANCNPGDSRSNEKLP